MPAVTDGTLEASSVPHALQRFSQSRTRPAGVLILAKKASQDGFAICPSLGSSRLYFPSYAARLLLRCQETLPLTRLANSTLATPTTPTTVTTECAYDCCIEA